MAPSAAIVPARRMLGSARVSSTNQPIRPIVASQRNDGRALASSGPAAASTNETF